MAFLLLGLLLIGNAPQAQAPGLATRLQTYEASGQTGFPSALSAAEWKTLSDELFSGGSTWLSASPSQRSHRLGILGTFVLDVSRGSLDRNWPSAKSAIEWVCRQYSGEKNVTETERLWHLAAISLAEGAGDFHFLTWTPPPNTRVSRNAYYDHLTHAELRIGNVPWLALTRAIAHERETYPDHPRQHALGTEAEMKKAYETLQYIKNFGLQMGSIAVETIMMGREYERRLKMRAAAKEFLDLRRHPDVAIDATLRAGVLLSRLKQDQEAIVLLGTASQSGGNFVKYVAHFHAAKLAERVGRADDAVAHYRAAMAIIPEAQSAPFGLAALQAQRGRVGEARLVVEESIKRPTDEDPAKEYGTGTLHRWPERITALRATAGVGPR